jgi:hypothetical protein
MRTRVVCLRADLDVFIQEGFKVDSKRKHNHGVHLVHDRPLDALEALFLHVATGLPFVGQVEPCGKAGRTYFASHNGGAVVIQLDAGQHGGVTGSDVGRKYRLAQAAFYRLARQEEESMKLNRPLLRNLIRQRRIELELSVVELARAAGCSAECISNIEAGREQIPGFRVRHLAAGLRLDRGDVCRYYLHQLAPQSYRQVFGTEVPPVPRPKSK